jgi:hypothetical protein
MEKQKEKLDFVNGTNNNPLFEYTLAGNTLPKSHTITGKLSNQTVNQGAHSSNEVIDRSMQVQSKTIVSKHIPENNAKSLSSNNVLSKQINQENSFKTENDLEFEIFKKNMKVNTLNIFLDEI